MIIIKIIVVSDFHADMYDSYAKPLNGKPWNDRFQNQLDTLDKIFDLAVKYKAKVIFNGDLFNQRVNINQIVYTQIVNKIVERSYQLQMVIGGHPVYFVAGNHDQYDNSRIPENSLAIFKLFEANTEDQRLFRVINYPSTLVFKDTNLVFLPYSEDVDWSKSQLNQQIKGLNKNSAYLFAHIGVDGAKQGRWNHRLGGAFSLGDLQPNKFNQIVLGHYHLRQTLQDDSKHLVYYVGNTVPLNHNDDFQKKGVYLIDTEDNSAKFIAINNPLFMTLDTNKYSADEIKDISKSNYIKLVTHSKEDLVKFKKDNQDLTVAYDPTDKKPVEDLGIKITDSTKEIVKSYTDEYYPKQTKLALEVLNKTQTEKK